MFLFEEDEKEWEDERMKKKNLRESKIKKNVTNGIETTREGWQWETAQGEERESNRLGLW